MFFNLFKNLTGSVGRTGDNNSADVAGIEASLGREGYLDLKKTDGPTGYFGIRMEDAVKKFQKDNGLKADGVINPGGETIGQLAQKIGERRNNARNNNKKPIIIPEKSGETRDVFMDTKAIAPGTRDQNEMKRKKWLWPKKERRI